MTPLLCPFCESTALNIGYSFSLSGKKRYVSCKCGAQGPEMRTESEAIAAWNSRMRVWVYDPETLTGEDERRTTETYIYHLKEGGFTPVLVAATLRECKHEFVYSPLGWQHSFRYGYLCRFCGKLQKEG
ncbi:Lar family restriction alleviation protein [Enterobacter hormaechei]|uniref:Lar family restriction alleviation protein n=1 Tax=Enterobacter hormaechei TaxID=158836 RepID=UPI003F54A0AB